MVIPQDPPYNNSTVDFLYDRKLRPIIQKRSARMRTRRKGRWLPKQPRLGARMCLGTFFFTMIPRDPDKLSIDDGRMTAIHGQKEETTASHGKHIRNE